MSNHPGRYLPGHPAAVERGCTCPQSDNRHGRGSYKGTGFIIAADCPLHDPEAPDE